MLSLKTLVSLPRKRITQDGTKYDIANITPQLIVGSMPTTNYWRSWYRMSGEDLKQYLDTTYGPNWRIWNLQESRENDYSDEFFEHRVSRYPIPDHTPPPLYKLLEIVADITDYLQTEGNVAFIHCKAGMGRSGTVACAYLQLAHLMTFETSLVVFTQARMRKMFGNGVGIPSQLRYLRYIEKFKRERLEAVSVAPSSRRVKILAITLRNPKYDDINVDVVTSIKKEGIPAAAHNWDRTVKTAGELTVAQFTPASHSLYSHIDVELSFSRAKQIKGVPITHSTAAVFFNGVMESYTSDDDLELPTLAKSPASASRFSCPWSQFDGIGGTWFKGTPLCESLEVSFEVVEGVSPAPLLAELEDDTRYRNDGEFSPEISAFDPGNAGPA